MVNTAVNIYFLQMTIFVCILCILRCLPSSMPITFIAQGRKLKPQTVMEYNRERERETLTEDLFRREANHTKGVLKSAAGVFLRE